MPIEDDDNYVDDEVYDDDEGLGAEGEGTTGEDPGEGDDETGSPTERADAPSEQDDGASSEEEAAVQRRAPAEDAQRPLGRAAARVQRLLRERQDTQRRIEALEREKEDYRRQVWQRSQTETQQQRDARLAVMTPEERTAYEWREWQQGVDRQVQGLRQQGAMELDQMKFQAKAAIDPHYARWEAKVEEVFQDRLRQGLPMAQREVILDYLVGKHARESAKRSTRQARADGKARIRAAETRPGSNRSDATTTRGKREGGISQAEANLRGVEI